MKEIDAGLQHFERFIPTEQHFASRVGNHGVDVVATTSLILFFEETANNLVAPYFDSGEVSVGTHVCVDHLAPAIAGSPIEVEAELTLIKGRRLEFQLQARQAEKLIMQGQHHRAVIQRQDTSQEKSDPTSSPRLEFWFDFHSPWCYFASHRIGEIAREFNAELIWKPVHLANLNQAVEGRRPLEANANFVAWYQQDMRDTAFLQGLPFEQHASYPCRPSRALRASIYAEEQGLAAPFVMQLMQGYWSQQKDISSLEWLCEVASSVGLDSEAVKDSAGSDTYKTKLHQNLEQAIEGKMFGLPVVRTQNKLFWGNDRLDLLRRFLSGELKIA